VKPDTTLQRVARGDSLVLDTSALIAYVRGDERASVPAARIVDELIRSGRNSGIVSAVSVAELMVRPLEMGLEASSRMAAFLLGYPGLSIRSTDFLVAAEAARIRVLTRATTPDALIAATATLTGSRWLVTNDRVLRDRLLGLSWQTETILLSDLAME
jgi:predicted nucleic acid-binding protein